VLFRSKLANNAWAVRGAAKQSAVGKPVTTVTGDVNDEQPDATTLFLAGGVEVLEVSVPASAEFSGQSPGQELGFHPQPGRCLFLLRPRELEDLCPAARPRP